MDQEDSICTSKVIGMHYYINHGNIIHSNHGNLLQLITLLLSMVGGRISFTCIKGRQELLKSENFV